MIKGTFEFEGDIFEAIVDGNHLYFRDVSTQEITTLEGLRFDYSGVLKEFPELEDDEEWKSKAIERLKGHFKTLKSDEAKLDYIKEELNKYGWKALFKQQAGFRTTKWRD